MHFNTNLKSNSNIEENFTSLDVQYDQQRKLAWYTMNANPRPCFTAKLIHEIRAWFEEIITEKTPAVDYIIMKSSTPGVFNLGGDLNMFIELIRTKNRETLMQYALDSIDPLYLIHTGLGKDITTISLVQGDALGAGFEVALSSDVLIAEKSAKMGLPEVLFNMFPGMGAYSFLSRKTSMSLADKMILSGKLYSAKELYEMGVIDILVEDGEGEKAVYDYIRKEQRANNTYKAIRKAKRYCNPVTFEELKQITSIWVDANMQLGAKELRMMERLIARQSKISIR